MPGFTLPSHLLGVFTDLAQVTGICPDLHPTPHLLVSTPSVPWSVTPWNRPSPASNPNLSLHVRLPIAPFQKSPWLALEPAGLTLNSKDPPAYACCVLGLKAHTTMTSFGHLLTLSLMSMDRHPHHYSSSLPMAVRLSSDTNCSFISPQTTHLYTYRLIPVPRGLSA